MKWFPTLTERVRFVASFSLYAVYVLSFLFDGEILHTVLDLYKMPSFNYIFIAILAHFLGLLTCGFVVKKAKYVKTAVLSGIVISIAMIFPFFFSPSILWFVGLIVGGYVSGCVLASWGFQLRNSSVGNEKLKTCADLLIFSNILMMLINFITIKFSSTLSFIFVLVCLCSSFLLSRRSNSAELQERTAKQKETADLPKTLLLLCIFISVLTINSGLMYAVINPSFEHLTHFSAWYWVAPYIVILFILRNLPSRFKHSRMLYVGIGMIISAFLGFMVLKRDILDYFIINTLMLSACGVFDLFWWSILAEMLDYTRKPNVVFGIGLSANVLGVLGGALIGRWATFDKDLQAEITVVALTVVCITLIILPLLNRRLVYLLKSHAYLTNYESMDRDAQSILLNRVQVLEPLTTREREVLEEILLGKSNREIAEELDITESTVKTHVRNIFSKYAVHTRAELISRILMSEKV